MIRRLAAFGYFCYDFVVGDDWRLAVAVAVALALTALAAATATLPAWVITPVVALGALVVSARRETRRPRG
ncbi:MAG: hypothetical protein ACRDN9_09095 [Streptosporangiaceae bacterium]